MALSKRLLDEARALGVDVTRYPGQKELRLAVRKAAREAYLRGGMPFEFVDKPKYRLINIE